jgi:NitT/TauT family transport system substrate-binding protein
MTHHIRNIRPATVLNLIRMCVVAAIVFSTGNTLAASSDDSPVRMAYLQNDIHHLACWTAIEKGYYSDNKVNVEVAGVFRAGPEIMTAFAAGELDMAYVGEAPATIAVANQTAKVVAVAQVNTEGSSVVVARDATGITDLKSLSSKTVAVPGHGTVQDFLLRRALSHQGIELGALNIIVLKPPEMISALRTNQIQAFIAWEPHPSKALTMGVGRRLSTSHDLWPGHPCCVLVASADFIARHPRKVQAVVRAHMAATDFINRQPQEALRIGMQYTGMDELTVKDAVGQVSYTTILNVEAEEEYVHFLKQLNYIRISDEKAFIKSFLDTNWVQGK